MDVRIKAFGITKDIVGAREIKLNFTGTTVASLRQQLQTTYPALKGLNSLFVAVNNSYAEEDTILQSTDEIALIPPVSGG
jgi:molybdopterin synthase sulfur carrier subunit